MLTHSVSIVLLISLSLSAPVVFGLYGDPTKYFGGVDNDIYVEWIQGKKDANYSSAYLNASSSDVTQGAAVHWKIDEKNQEIYVAVAARAEGWLGLGLAEAGGMKGSDIVYYEVANPNKLTDAYVLGENAKPITDSCQQDWEYLNAVVDGGFLIFEGKRKFVTGDSQDRDIINDAEVYVPAQKLIVAWGDTESISFHGPTKTARGAVRWYADGDVVSRFHETMLREADGYMDIRVYNFTIPSSTTTYMSFCTNWGDILAQAKGKLDNVSAVSFIGAEVILTPAARHIVHHANVYGNSEVVEEPYKCLPDTSYSDLLYSYSPGELPFELPANVGFTVGPGGTSQSFRLEVHYNNALNEENIVDNGGLRAYYTVAKRPEELSVAYFGDVLNTLKGNYIHEGVSSYEFDCPAGCSDLIEEKVTVIAEYFHMHETGVSAEHQVIRDGKVVHTSRVNFWDFTQVSTMPVRQTKYELLPGDTFKTKCYYNNTKGDLKFGFESSEEMCQIGVLYYPAKRMLYGTYPWACPFNVPFPLCSSTMTSSVEQERILTEERGLEGDQCPGENGVDFPSGAMQNSMFMAFLTMAYSVAFTLS